jgi:hypothetical protein
MSAAGETSLKHHTAIAKYTIWKAILRRFRARVRRCVAVADLRQERKMAAKARAKDSC